METQSELFVAERPLPPVPEGWRVEDFTNAGGTFKRALCPDGFVHYFDGDRWRLNVPWFPNDNDAEAICEHITGNVRRPIDGHNVIILPSRAVGPRDWNH